MSEYYSPPKKSLDYRLSLSSQSSDDTQAPAKRHHNLSSLSSNDDGPAVAKRQYNPSVSQDTVSSQSEAETSQHSEQTASDSDSDDSGSGDETTAYSGPSFSTNSHLQDEGGSDDEMPRAGFSGFSGSASFSMTEDNLTYRAASDPNSTSILKDGGVAAKLMAKMGYQAGTGLGRHAQGRVDPVEASKQKGRRGLGMAPSNFELESDLAWREEEISPTVEIEWMTSLEDPDLVPSLESLQSQMRIDKKKLTIDDETEFVHPEVIKQVLGCKSVFDELEGAEMRKARTHSNPFEIIKGVFFQNRAAMKMAEIDAIFDFMFTSPKDRSGASLVKPGELLYFADICAGPGGFSEYVLWRKKWRCKGFGLTLKSGPGVNDFKLDEFYVSPSECFEPHYGKGGVDGDGDIYNQENIDTFAKFVKENSNNRGLHFVMADGGFSVEGQENEQEILSKRLYLCQFLCAMSVLRDGGHFTCKLFDVFTPFSVGLMYLMRFAFDQVCITKPVTSRPANSERYIVCKGYKCTPGAVVVDYLTYVNLAFEDVKFGSTQHKKCIQHIINLDTLKDDEEFYDYIYRSNCELGRQQCLNLKKIQVFAKNPSLREERQMDVREQCLKLWKIPDKIRTAPERMDCTNKIQSLMKTDSLCPLGDCQIHDMDVIQKDVKSIYDFKVFVSGVSSVSTAPSLHYYLSMGHSLVYKWDGVSSHQWKRVTDDDLCRLQLDIPRDSLFVAEVVQELKGEAKGQKRLYSLHITDILFLYGEDFRHHSYNVRLDAAQMFVSAITKHTRTRLTPIRVKQLYRIEELPSLIANNLDYRVIKGCGSEPKLCYTGDFSNSDKCCHSFKGLHFIPYMRKPWTMAYSRSAKRKYFYNMETKKSVFEANQAGAGFSPTDYSLKHKILFAESGIDTRHGLDNMKLDLHEWIKAIAPWLHS